MRLDIIALLGLAALMGLWYYRHDVAQAIVNLALQKAQPPEPTPLDLLQQKLHGTSPSPNATNPTAPPAVSPSDVREAVASSLPPKVPQR